MVDRVPGILCAKPPLQATVYRLHKHKKADIVPPSKGLVSVLNQ